MKRTVVVALVLVFVLGGAGSAAAQGPRGLAHAKEEVRLDIGSAGLSVEERLAHKMTLLDALVENGWMTAQTAEGYAVALQERSVVCDPAERVLRDRLEIGFGRAHRMLGGNAFRAR